MTDTPDYAGAAAKFRGDVVMPGVGKDTEIEVNAAGAGQSKIPYAFHLVDGLALGKMAEVLKEGADKYGADNWRMLPIEDHLNHLIMHAYAWLAGDRSDDHLSHIMCRAMFAQGVDVKRGPMSAEEFESWKQSGVFSKIFGVSNPLNG